MRYVIMILAACVIASACSSTDSCTKDLRERGFSVTISKGMCFGTCPVYSGTVYGDGKIVYEGQTNTERMGTYSGMIPSEVLCSLATEVQKNKLMTSKAKYIDNVPDAPVTTITITNMGQTTVISYNMGSPEPLRELTALLVTWTHENQTLKRGL